MPTMVVIDNERNEMMRLGVLLQAAFPEWTVLPEKKRREQETFRDWSEVFSYLLGIDDSDVILCVDLSLEQRDWDDVRRGVHQVQDFRRSRPDWTFIAFTKNSRYASSMPEFALTFHEILEKETLAKQTTFESSVDFVRSVVERARRRQSRDEVIPRGVRIVDSLGMRSFRAAFSDQILGELVRREARDWGSLQVRSLTSGYSGAFMLMLASDTGDRSLILKIVKNEETIAAELRAQKDHLPELKPFGASFVLIQPDMQSLPDGSGVYYRQVPVEGSTVLQYCLANSTSANLASIEQVTRMCLRVLAAAPVADRPHESARRRFCLTPVDVGRLETSAEFLAELGTTLARNSLWPAELPSAEQIAAEMTVLAQKWYEDRITDVWLAESVQHGDLNPGNVIIDADGIPVLIDFQRLGRWPLGYDIARLAGLLRIRLTAARDKSDWLPFLFSTWCEECVALSKGMEIPHPVCPEAAFCESQFLEYAAGLPATERVRAEYGYYLASLWDLIKITSYQDISVFKRAWALVLAWSTAQRLRRDRLLLRDYVSDDRIRT